MQRVCVYCGSRPGARPEYRLAAQQLGAALAASGLGLVYGGGHVGLMGVLADAALAGGGEVIGVIPQALHDREVGHAGLSELHVVDDMHTRKAKMIALADAFVVMPGGLGTLEELFEVWTWAQLDFHRKPIGLLDTAGYWQPLVQMLEHVVAEGFAGAEIREVLCVASEPAQLLTNIL